MSIQRQKRRSVHPAYKKQYGRDWADISGASKFEQIMVNTYARYSDLITAESEFRFRFHPSVRAPFVKHLSHYSMPPSDGDSVGNVIASSLTYAVSQATDGLRTPIPVEELWGEWGDGRHTWEPWGEHVVMVDEDGSIEGPYPTDIVESKNQLGITLSMFTDDNEPPTMTLELVGAPVCSILMNAATYYWPEDRKPFQQKADRLLKGVFGLVRTHFGLQKPKEGRPQSFIGANAARLLHHEGKSLNAIVRQLCEEDHVHNSLCKDRIRKAIKNFYRQNDENIRKKLEVRK